MSRVELIFPDPVVFTEQIGLRTTDMSWAGHLGFEKLVGLLQHVQTRFFERCGLPPGGGRGIGTIVKDLAVVYQGEAHAGDVVSVNVGLGESGRKWIELYFQVVRQSTVEVAIAKLAVLCFDYDTGATVAFPPGVRKALDNGYI